MGSDDQRTHRFGGDWTETKLEVLGKYLRAYTTALRDKPSAIRPFKKAYIDAFAGTGYRTPRGAPKDTGMEFLFPEDAADEQEALLDGSARLALQVEPPFDAYIFIEQDSARCASLHALKSEFPEKARSIRVEQADANDRIKALCQKPWRSRRAVLFLDPYGAQVDWSTIEAVARTGAIDLWILFPLGMAVNRLLPRSGQVPPAWRRCLDRLLGTDDWFEHFHRVESSPTLFGEEGTYMVKESVDTIGRFFNDRLRSVFAGVVDEPGVLRNSTGCPLYLLCFAAANPKGAPTAKRIASYLLKDLR